MTVLGIDIGGSGIKGAPVDVDAGALIEERVRVETPRPATPDAVLPALVEVAGSWKGSDPVGVTFPGVVRRGVIGTCREPAPGLARARRGGAVHRRAGRPVTVLNDADAAGVAEMAFGAGRNVRGVVLLLTFGTGIGSALFLDGRLVPNTELGHLELHGADAELHASDRIRDEQELSWPDWAARVQDYIAHVERLLCPDLFIIGGGVSKKADRFLPLRQGRHAGRAGGAAEQRRHRRRGDGHHRTVLTLSRRQLSERRQARSDDDGRDQGVPVLPRTTSRVGRTTSVGPGAGSVEGVEQQPRGDGALLLDGLGDRREVDDRRHLVVVEPTTDMRPGTAMLARRSVRTAPIASSSYSATTAVGSVGRSISVGHRRARRPRCRRRRPTRSRSGRPARRRASPAGSLRAGSGRRRNRSPARPRRR